MKATAYPHHTTLDKDDTKTTKREKSPPETRGGPVKRDPISILPTAHRRT